MTTAGRSPTAGAESGLDIGPSFRPLEARPRSAEVGPPTSARLACARAGAARRPTPKPESSRGEAPDYLPCRRSRLDLPDPGRRGCRHNVWQDCWRRGAIETTCQCAASHRQRYLGRTLVRGGQPLMCPSTRRFSPARPPNTPLPTSEVGSSTTHTIGLATNPKPQRLRTCLALAALSKSDARPDAHRRANVADAPKRRPRLDRSSKHSPLGAQAESSSQPDQSSNHLMSKSCCLSLCLVCAPEDPEQPARSRGPGPSWSCFEGAPAAHS